MVNFFEFTRVDGAGNSNVINSYEVKDNELFSGDNFYRLKQVDFDGTKETFNTIVINCDKSNDSEAIINVYPNPFRSVLKLYIENLNDQDVELIFLDETGRIVLKKSIFVTDKLYETSIDLKELKPAIYYLRLVSDLKVFNIKVTKQ